MENSKICKKCGSSEMAWRKNTKLTLGGHWNCLACRRANYQQNLEHMRELARRHGRTELAKATQRKYRRQGRYKQTARKYRENNKELYREAYQKWAKNNPARVLECAVRSEQKRRARKRGVINTLTPAEWNEIQQRFHHRCAYCGERKKLTIDHVTPLNDFGGHTANNIVPACKSCNCKKYTGPPPVPVQTLLFA